MQKEESLWDTGIMFLFETVNSHWSNESKSDIPKSKLWRQIALDLQKHQKNILRMSREWKKKQDHTSYVIRKDR